MSQGKVIVVGSVNVDLVVSVPRLPSPGESVMGDSYERHGGGKGANKALAAARAGAASVFVAAVGADEAGEEALAGLAREGVDVSRCLRLSDAPTGVALIVVDSQGDNQIAVAPGANARLDGSAVEEALAALPSHPSDVLLADFEVGSDAVLAAARWARARGLRTIVNPAPARPIEEELLRCHPILTPNASEAAALAGTASPGDAARTLAGRTKAPVVVTLGREGALAFIDGEAHLLPGHRVATVDSTGAGDALNGILCAALARGDSLLEAVRWGMAGAALSTTARGARAGLPYPSDIDRMLGRE